MFVEGQLRTRKWTDQSGIDRYSTEIVLGPYNGTLTFLDNKKDGNGERASGERQPSPAGAGADPDDEIPF